MTETINSSETSVDFYQTASHQIKGDIIVHETRFWKSENVTQDTAQT